MELLGLSVICNHKKKIWATLTIILMIGLSGCADNRYKKTVVGKLEGNLIVEWRKPNYFVYIPSPDNPLRFTRGTNGDVIEPKRMGTDGGSIPRQFWVFKNYSPWGYGPAFIIHDWLFHMQDCELPGYDQYDLKTAAVIMSEVMKTLIENPEFDFDYGDPSSIYMMYKAVQTTPARRAWDDRDCKPVDALVLQREPDAIFQIKF